MEKLPIFKDKVNNLIKFYYLQKVINNKYNNIVINHLQMLQHHK